jgi:hypothetical protein
MSDWRHESKSGLPCDPMLRIDFPAAVAGLSASVFDFLGECPKLWAVREGLFESVFDFQAFPWAESSEFQVGHRTD